MRGPTCRRSWVLTPTGPVTALGLSQTRAPSGIAILEGDDLRVLCATTGHFDAGVMTCADSAGGRYIGNW